MQAITTKYMPPTNTKPSRIRVQCDALTAFYSWDHALNILENHAHAVAEHAARLLWNGMWEMDHMPQKSREYAVAICVERGHVKPHIVEVLFGSVVVERTITAAERAA